MPAPPPKPAKDTSSKPTKRSLAERVEAAVKKFQQQVEAFARSQVPKPRQPASSSMGSVTPQIRRAIAEYTFARNLTIWLFFSVVALAVMVAVIFYGASAAASRPVGFVKGTPSISARARAHMAESFTPNLDTINLYLWNTLPLLQTITPSGQPNINLLRGVVAPEILNGAISSYGAQQVAIKKNMAVQTLVLESVGNVIVDKEKNRVSVYVRGFFLVGVFVGKGGPKPDTVPYRARVILEPNIPNAVNPTHFFMVELNERVGAKAPLWDREQVLQK